MTATLPQPAPTDQQTADELLPAGWAADPRWAGIQRTYTAQDVVALRGSVREEHTLARRGAERLWELLHDAGVRPRARRADRQPGRAAGPGRARGDLPVRLAGRRRRQPVRPDLPGPDPVPGQLGARGGPADQQRAAAGRPDRRSTRDRPRSPRAAGADRRRRRGRLRRPAERVRADEGDDRGRRGGRALGGPAGRREEVRPPGRQGAHPDGAAHPHAERGPAGGRRRRRADRSSSPGPTRWAPTC